MLISRACSKVKKNISWKASRSTVCCLVLIPSGRRGESFLVQISNRIGRRRFKIIRTGVSIAAVPQKELNFQFDNCRVESLFLNSEARDDDRQLEASRPGAAGIEKQYAVQVCDTWFMRVTADDRSETLRRGVDFQLVDIMNEVNAETVYSEL